MVAAVPHRKAGPHAAILPRSILSGQGALLRLTVRQVQQMIEQSIIPEDASTELLNGVIVLKDRGDLGEGPHVHGKRHRLGVSLLTRLVATIDRPACHVQIQLPVVCGEDQAPEPDFAIVAGQPQDYADQLPPAGRVSCVIEVADSSLERDSQEKLAIYAAAGIGQYLIVNLRNNTIECFDAPDRAAATYRTKFTTPSAGTLSLNLPDGATVDVPASSILPTT